MVRLLPLLIIDVASLLLLTSMWIEWHLNLWIVIAAVFRQTRLHIRLNFKLTFIMSTTDLSTFITVFLRVLWRLFIDVLWSTCWHPRWEIIAILIKVLVILLLFLYLLFACVLVSYVWNVCCQGVQVIHHLPYRWDCIIISIWFLLLLRLGCLIGWIMGLLVVLLGILGMFAGHIFNLNLWFLNWSK